MHSQAVLFSCGNASCSGCGYGGSQSRTDFLCGISELAQLSVSILAGFVGFLDGIGEVLGFISGFVKAFGGFFRGGSVGTKVTRSMPFRAACALFSCICQLWVRRSFSPNDSAAFARAERSVSIFCFCWSISLFRTSLRAVSASVDLSFLSNWESTSFSSEPRTLNELFISARDFLNSFSPSRPIFKPKFSDILFHLLEKRP